MMAKVDVNGENAAPLYKYLTSKETNPKFGGEIKWNFEKFLFNRDGTAGRPLRAEGEAGCAGSRRGD